jgi:hypothetical protein
MRRTILMICLLSGTSAFAQKVAVKKVELAGEKIIVHYDLEDSNPNNEYQIFLYSSQNNFSTALTKVKGDVGSEVKSGSDRKIEWNIMEELGPYKGKLALEVRGNVYAPFVKLQNFDVSRKYKRGKSYPLQWKPGTSTPIHIELYKGSERLDGELNHPNNGSYSMAIPGKAKAGKDYRLKITDSKNSDQVLYSGYFRVTPKVPLLYKLLPLAIIGGVASTLGGGGGGEPTTPPTNEIELPGFPDGN